MYIGIGAEKGKRVLDKDAFSYAFERCVIGADQEEFMQNFRHYISTGLWIEKIDEFREELVEWFYSGNWQYREE